MTKETFENARPRRGGFTTVVNPMLDDSNLNLEAKGLLTILVSNSNAWDLNMAELFKRSGNGRDAHYNIINELILEGYFCRLYILKEGNKHEEVIYIFSDDKEHVTNRTNELIDKKKKEGKKIIVENYLSKRFYAKKFPKKLSLRVEKKLQELETQGIFPFPEFQDTEENKDQKPLPEIKDTENTDSENQDINNTNVKKTNLKNTKSSMYVSTDSDNSSIEIYKENYKLTKYAKKQLESFIETHGEDLTKYAVERTIKKGKEENMISYIVGMLKKWAELGLKSISEIETHEKAYWEAKKTKRSTQKKSGKQSYNMNQSKPLPVAIQAAQNEVQKGSLESASGLDDMTDEERMADIKATLGFLRRTEGQVL